MKYDFVYCCDGYPAIGFGHVKRGIDIINAIQCRNPDYRSAFCGTYSPTAEKFLNDRIPKNVDVLPAGKYPRNVISVVDTMFDPQNPEVFNEDECRKMKNVSSRLFLISGLLSLKIPQAVDALISHCPDIVLSGNTKAKRYLGFDYAPVNIEFEKYRDTGFDVPKETILCVIGGNDRQYGPKVLLSKLTGYMTGAHRFECVLSPYFPEPEKAAMKKRFPDVIFYQNVPDLAPLFQRAKALICTYGHTTYESLFFHIPTFVVSYKQFQKVYADNLEDRGLVVNLGFFETMDENKLQWIFSEERLGRLSENAERHFKTAGIENIAGILIEAWNKCNEQR